MFDYSLLMSINTIHCKRTYFYRECTQNKQRSNVTLYIEIGCTTQTHFKTTTVLKQCNLDRKLNLLLPNPAYTLHHLQPGG